MVDKYSNYEELSRHEQKGTSLRNICNKCPTRQGMQLEITCNLREALLQDRQTFNRFVAALRNALSH